MYSRRGSLRSLLPLLVATGVAGCDPTRPTGGRDNDAQDDAAVRRPAVVQSLDHEFAELAKDVPGFGGGQVLILLRKFLRRDHLSAVTRPDAVGWRA